MEKLIIERAPMTEERLAFRRLIQDRGELALLEDGLVFNHLACFTLRPGPGLFRGGHMHRSKVEHFYVLAGAGVLKWADPATGRKGSAKLGAGEKITVLPGLAHRFEAMEELTVVEYYQGVYDPADDIPFQDFE